MNQIRLFQEPSWSVSQLTRYLRNIIEGDRQLQDLWVTGEVSNLSRPSSGHLYFNIKDNQSIIRVVMWRSNLQRQVYVPNEGDALDVHGSINIYESAGYYQIYADSFRPAGEGTLFTEFLRLKARLESEGLFNPERKRPIPRWSKSIAIVTSPTGAALRDILDTINRRYPLVQVVLAPSLVQGEGAAQGIAKAIQDLNRLVKPDIIILARGGGSIEDLWAFNDEHVARAIYLSNSPVITGIGHETDFTIADFVSDLRAPTPTAAAELATPNQVDLRNSLIELQNRLYRSSKSSINTQLYQYAQLVNKFEHRSPINQIHSYRQKIDDLLQQNERSVIYTCRLLRTRLSALEQQLTTLNPQSVLARGYAIATKEDGTIIRSIHQVELGDEYKLLLEDGILDSEVKFKTQL